VRILEGLIGKKANVVDTPAPASEPIQTYADVSKAKRLIGYEPKVKFEEGLRRLVEWMRSEGIIE
jgi:UDP-glucuronate 4-epimerase